MTQITPEPTSAEIAVSYFAAMSSLTQKSSGQTSSITIEEPDTIIPPVFSPFIPYAPVILFFALFISAFGMQLIRKVLDARRIITAFALAFFAASIPTVLTVMQQRSVSQTHAGPDEIPRNVTVTRHADYAVVVAWHTDAEKIGAVRVSTAPFTQDTAVTYIADNGAKVRDHSVILSDLKPDMTYQFEVFSGTAWYDHNGIPISFHYMDK